MSSRRTLQKQIVLDAVMSFDGHPTPDNIYDKIHPNYPTVSRATVFRILNELKDNGTLARVYIPGGTTRYDRNNDGHFHCVCSKCGKITDVRMKDMNDPISAIDCCGDYEVKSFVLEFTGLCPDCKIKYTK